MAANARGASVEFIVKPKEDLHLEGSCRKLPRVLKGEPYPCQMQKTQAFSCLFRHYAKHNGLRKEDLVFYFTDELQPDQTPESVHLMLQDEIFVEHRKPVEKVKEEDITKHFYAENFRKLLTDSDHSDITFIFPSTDEKVLAHKAILSARCEYFETMFKKGGMAESQSILSKLVIENYEKSSFTKMLEYVYTNNVVKLDECQTSEIEALLILANEYLLKPLQHLCEIAASRMLTFDNISRFTILSMSYSINDPTDPKILKHACKVYLSNNMAQLRRDEQFRKEIEEYPQIGLFLFDTWPEDNNSSNSINTISSSSVSALKKRRISSSSSPSDSLLNMNTSSMASTSTMYGFNNNSNSNHSFSGIIGGVGAPGVDLPITTTHPTATATAAATATIQGQSNEITGPN